jgi:hypothetical protein
MDRARQDWFYEHAETGRPGRSNDDPLAGTPVSHAACKLRGSRGQFGKRVPYFPGAEFPRKRRTSNGAAGQYGPLSDPATGPPGSPATTMDCRVALDDGHRFSAIESPQSAARPAYSIGHPLWFVAVKAARRAEAVAPAPLRCSAHPFPCRFCASPSNLAAGSSCLVPLDGKVRWQKRFAFPARRMRRGLRF